MTNKFSGTLGNAIHKILTDVEHSHGILDAYSAAGEIQKAHPDENVAVEDIVDALLTGRGEPRRPNDLAR